MERQDSKKKYIMRDVGLFFIIGVALATSFLISQVKVTAIKGKVRSVYLEKKAINKKKRKKALSQNDHL